MAGGAHHKLLGLHLQTPTLLADSDHIRFLGRRKSPAEKEYDEERRKQSQSHNPLIISCLARR